MALIKRVAMQLGNYAHRTPPTLAALGAPRHVTLLEAQFLLCGTIPARIAYDFRIAGDGKRFQTNVYANSVAIGGQRFRVSDARKARIPFSVFTFEGERFHVASQRPMHLDFHIADFR